MATLTNYQARAAQTAQPAAYDHAYLIPMIVGEVGELFGQRAKAVWHGWDADRIQLELVSEYGDICWGVAILLQMEGANSLQGSKLRRVDTCWCAADKPDAWAELQTRAGWLYTFHTQRETHQYIVAEAKQLWLLLAAHCEEITGLPFDAVLEANLAKLASRAARGTLVGQGDHR
jgi:hypothetical protein